jgi:hypothetical protein
VVEPELPVVPLPPVVALEDPEVPTVPAVVEPVVGDGPPVELVCEPLLHPTEVATLSTTRAQVDLLKDHLLGRL